MGKYTGPQFFWDQFSYHPPVVRADLTGQTVIVLGANVGLGYEAAKHFATMGARVIMACRSKERGSAAVDRLQEETGVRNAELRIVDLADFASVKSFAAVIEAECDRVDFLILNAGVLSSSDPVKTVDGWESTLQVNVLASSMLALLLLPTMLETARRYHVMPRVVVVSSSVHYWLDPWDKKTLESPNVLKALSETKDFTPLRRYYESKLFNVFFTRALNERLRPTHPTLIVNSVNPGLAESSLRRDMDESALPWSMRLIHLFLTVSSEVGSRELVWAALGGRERAEALRGAYIDRCEVREPSDFALSEEGRIMQDRVWREIVEVTSEAEPRVKEIVTKYLLDL